MNRTNNMIPSHPERKLNNIITIVYNKIKNNNNYPNCVYICKLFD